MYLTYVNYMYSPIKSATPSTALMFFKPHFQASGRSAEEVACSPDSLESHSEQVSKKCLPSLVRNSTIVAIMLLLI